MHTKRVIPCLDIKDGRVVKGINFVNLRDAGDPADVAAADACKVEHDLSEETFEKIKDHALGRIAEEA